MKRLFRLGGGDERRIRREVDEEVGFHLERKVEALMAGGLSREEAEREARRRFGDVEAVKDRMETTRRRREAKMRMGSWWSQWRQDVEYAVRQLRRAPGFSLVVVLTLALGIGMNTAIFSVVDGILFRPLPFPEPEELVNVWSDVTRRGGPDDEWLSYANFDDLATRSRTLESLAAWGGFAPTWTDTSAPEQLLAGLVTVDMFPRVLRVEPVLGRSFTQEEDAAGAAPVALLSHGFWERAFGSDPSVVGRTITLNDESTEIVGVMPPGFRPPFLPDAQLWLPTRVDAADQQDRRGGFSWRAVGRMEDDATVAAAREELREIGADLEATHPASNTGMTFTAVALRDDMVAEARTGLLVLLAAVGLVLLVACVNVANLLLARASSRRSELAVRAALGAGRGRITRQLLTESLFLAGVGGLAGVALAWFATDLLVSLAPGGTPRIDVVSVDGRVLAFTAVVSILSGLAFGLVPSLRAGGGRLQGALRQGGRGGLGRSGARLRSALVVGQVALALVLLVGAGLLLRSFQNLRGADLGFEPEDVVTFRVNLPGSRYEAAPELVAFADLLEERLARLPGVRSVGATSTVPLTGFDGDVGFHVQGHPLPEPGQENTAWIRQVTPGYLEVMEIGIVGGRGFTPSDREGDHEVVVINETIANRLFAGEDPIGRLVTFSDPSSPDALYREVVGVVRDIRNFGIREASRNAVYIPWAQAPRRALFPVLKVQGSPDPVVQAARREVGELDAALAVAQVRTMEDIVADEIAADRFVASLLTMFAGVGLVLAVVGLYGVVSYGVSTRVREMGVRMALGAGGRRVSGMVVGRSLVLVAVGVVAGLAGSFLLTGLMENLLFGVTGADPLVLTSVIVVLALAAATAAAVPAIRATRIPPSTALRTD